MRHTNDISVIEPFKAFTDRSRFKVAYGGRAGGRSWSIARLLLKYGMDHSLTILCTRQYQVNIGQSVYKLLVEQINLNKAFVQFYTIQKTNITGRNGTQFIFRGLQNPSEIKSLEGVDICWVEEAERVYDDSWDYLIPTIRKANSEIWVSFNPDSEDSATYKRFVLQKDDRMISVFTTYLDNPFVTEEVIKEAEHDRKTDIDKYYWIWMGRPKKIGNAQVFKDKWVIEDFDTPEDAQFYCGADWGFAGGPTAIIRCFVKDGCLYIDKEAGGHGVEIDEIGMLIDSVVPMKGWPVRGDSSRPDTISYLRRHGYNIIPSTKGAGSIEDGIAFLRSFDKIVIHPRCKGVIEEMRLYSYKVDKVTGDILPVIVDMYNHYIDALRYAVEDLHRVEPRVRMI